MATSSSTTTTPKSVSFNSNPFEKIKRRMSLDNLLEEAQLDRNALLQVLKENEVGMNDLDESKIQTIVQQASSDYHHIIYIKPHQTQTVS